MNTLSKHIIFFCWLLLGFNSFAQDKVADKVKYTIHANLHTQEKVINAIQTIDFTNNEEASVAYIWLHLYPNAFETDKTSFTRYSIQNGDTKFYFSNAKDRGYLKVSDIRVNALEAVHTMDSLNKEWVKISLPNALLKGESAKINISFSIKVPEAFDKLGYKEEKILLSYWYPALAVKNKDQWQLDDYVSHRYVNAAPANYEVFLKVDNQEYIFSVEDKQHIPIEIDRNTYQARLLEDSLQLNVGDNYWIKGGLKDVESKSDIIFENLLPKLFHSKVPLNPSKTLLTTYELVNKGQPIITGKKRTDFHSFLFEEIKAGKWYDSIKQIIGEQSFNKAIEHLKNTGYNLDADDLKEAFNLYTNNSLSGEFSLLTTSQSMYGYHKRTLKPAFLFSLKETDKYNYLSLTPALGFNNYNKLMIGALVHNYQLPYNKFNFVLAPLYATGDKHLAGLGRVEYNIFNRNQWWQVSLSGSQFAYNEVNISSLPEPLFYRYKRLVPGVKLTLYQDESSLRKWTFHAKDYLLKFSNYELESDGASGIVATPKTSTKNIVEFTSTFSNDRVLYPYNVSLQLFNGKEFVRAGITANYFFNYNASGKGLNARVFGGKFFYIAAQNFINQYNTTPYHFYMAGTSVTDFTYSDYFMGRSEQTGWMSRQITERDGFFKVNTPMRNRPLGASDNWLAALNFTADIPDEVNPFKNLPFEVPVKLFADVGTYADAWSDAAATGKFVYDAGIQISLFNQALNVYFPLLYSKAYRDYYKSVFGKNYFAKTISFSINFERLKPAKLKTILPI